MEESSEALTIAAAEHDIDALRSLLKTFSPNIQQPDTLNTPLHAAILSLRDAPKPVDDERKRKSEAAVSLLLENGAIWNPLNRDDETPGCIALKLGLTDLYDMMVMAGVRAEMIFNRLDTGLWQQVDDDDEEEAEDEVDELDSSGTKAISSSAAEDETNLQQILDHNKSVESDAYLSGDVSYDNDKLLSENGNAVMMSWESEIMKKSAQLLLPTDSSSLTEAPRNVMNIGFGMGIIDTEFQKMLRSEDTHYIVEAHDEVLKKMQQDGWLAKKNVIVLQGKWQDELPILMANQPELTFDAIYYDTFGESYSDLKEFFSEFVIGLLNPETGRFGFFNGLGADRQICYDVYSKVVELDLNEAGLDVEWEMVHVPVLGEEGEGTWKKVTRRYWVLDTYRLPTCRFG